MTSMYLPLRLPRSTHKHTSTEDLFKRKRDIERLQELDNA